MIATVLASAPSGGLDLAPTPVDLSANVAAAWFVNVAGFVSLAIAIAFLLRSVHRKDLVAIMLILSAPLFLLVEPVVDIVGGCWYAADWPMMMYTTLGRPMPLALVTGYSLWFSLYTYGAYKRMKHGAPARNLLLYAGCVGLTNVALEIFGVQNDLWSWYSFHGPNPAAIFGLPIYMAAFNGITPLVVAWVLCQAVPHLSGLRWSLLLPLIPSVVFGALAALIWPSILVNNMNVNDGVVWLGALISTAMCCGLAYVLVKSPIVAGVRQGGSVGGGVVDVPAARR
jgi:hypothetical protein